jgi:hypothetical protein
MVINYASTLVARLRQRFARLAQNFREAFPSLALLAVAANWVLIGLRTVLIVFPLWVLAMGVMESSWLDFSTTMAISTCFCAVSVAGIYLGLASKLVFLASPVGRRYLLLYLVCVPILLFGPLFPGHGPIWIGILGLVNTAIFLTFLTKLCSHFQWCDLVLKVRRLRFAFIATAGFVGATLPAPFTETSPLVLFGPLMVLTLYWSYASCLVELRDRLRTQSTEPIRFRMFLRNSF